MCADLFSQKQATMINLHINECFKVFCICACWHVLL